MAVTTKQISVPTYSVKDSEILATRKLLIPDWGDVEEFIDDNIGSSALTPGGFVLSQHTSFPGKEWLHLDTIDIKPFTNSVDAVDIEGVVTCSGGAEATLKYKTLASDPSVFSGGGDDPDLPDVPLLEHSVSTSIQVIKVPNAGLKWETSTNKVPTDLSPAISVPVLEHRLTMHRVSNPPWTNILATLGSVNDDDFLGHIQDTVLFAGVNGTRGIRFTDGAIQQRRWTMKYTFQARVHNTTSVGLITWDDFYNAKESKWERVKLNNDNFLLKESDFDLIFKGDTST